MAIRKYKPTSAGVRGMSVLTFDEITKTKPEKSLLVSLSKSGGRNSLGRVTVRHRGGGAKRKYRIIDFKRNKDGVPGKVASIEYDPNRTANIALIHYLDGEKRYILAPEGLKVGDKIYIKDNTGREVEYTIYRGFSTNPNDATYMRRDTKGETEVSLSTCSDDSQKRYVVLARKTSKN